MRVHTHAPVVVFTAVRNAAQVDALDTHEACRYSSGSAGCRAMPGCTHTLRVQLHGMSTGARAMGEDQRSVPTGENAFTVSGFTNWRTPPMPMLVLFTLHCAVAPAPLRVYTACASTSKAVPMKEAPVRAGRGTVVTLNGRLPFTL